jgi:hypothetical protein
MKGWRVLLMTVVLMTIAALAGLRVGHATCTTANVAGSPGTNISKVTDPSCGTTNILGVSWTNYCVTEQCPSASVGCDTGATCSVQKCPGGLNVQCHPYGGEYGDQCWQCLCP